MRIVLGVLFIPVLLVFAPVRTSALQLDCPFPEGTSKWDAVAETYVCKFSSTDVPASRAPHATLPVVVQQTPIVIQPVPLFQAPPYAGMLPFWFGGPVAYGPWSYYGWYGSYSDQDILFGAAALATIIALASIM